MAMARVHCFMLEVQEMARAFSRAFDSAGSSIAARMAMMAITTSSSISVKWRRGEVVFMVTGGFLILVWFGG